MYQKKQAFHDFIPSLHTCVIFNGQKRRGRKIRQEQDEEADGGGERTYTGRK